MADRRGGIEVGSLSKAYQDAIHATRALGVRYLWIDSLCILQGDLADWELESSHMSHIYQGAFLTLAATGATEPEQDGLFLLPAEENCFTVALDGKGQREPEQPMAIVRAPAASVSSLHAAPLNTRAWALQEMILSPRTVHFLPDQMYWQCRTLLLSEDGLVQDDTFASLRFRSSGRLQLDLADDRAAWEFWWRWAQDYSCRELTVRTDWLAALAGITQHFAEVTGKTPALGMWKETLIADLAWHINPLGYTGHSPGNDYLTVRHTAVSGVPSWSWMSVQMPVHAPIGNVHCLKREFFLYSSALGSGQGAGVRI
jgi:hypothetical protein